jgi:hypothetical protein
MIISIIVLIFLFLFFIKYLNDKKPVIQYLNKDELANILKKDSDNYYKKMSKLNLELRDIQDFNSYLLSIDKLLYTISNTEQVIINNAIKKADIHLKKASKILKKRKFVGFDYDKIKSYPWFIGCGTGKKFEFGYPHTRMDIIILNYENIYDPDLYKTLMHERIHIYQRLNPNNMKLFLNKYNFIKIKKYQDDNLSNPDTDNNLYSIDNKIFECKIIKSNDLKLTLDYTNNNHIYEHPYEWFAYKIVENFS